MNGYYKHEFLYGAFARPPRHGLTNKEAAKLLAYPTPDQAFDDAAARVTAELRALLIPAWQ